MKAIALISHNIPSLKDTDTGANALRLMNEFHVKHLPVVNQKRLSGLISDEDILNAHGVEENIGNIPISFTRPYIHGEDHLFELLKVTTEYKLTVLAVIDEQENFIGSITKDKMVDHLALETSLLEPGGIIVVEMNMNDYSLAEISRIIEAENMKILSAFTKSFPDKNLIELTVKINHTELQPVIASLNRHDFLVKEFYQEPEYFSDLKERYDSLMNYLDI